MAIGTTLAAPVLEPTMNKVYERQLFFDEDKNAI